MKGVEMSRWERAVERNRRMVEENADRVLTDTAYDRFRTPGALRGLVVGYAVVTVVNPVAWLVGGGIAGIVAALVALAVYLLLRVAVRSVADLPDHVLDERLRRDRDSVYLDSFRLLASLVFAAANVAFVVVAFGGDDASIRLDYEQVSAVYWTLLALIMGIPSAVLALREAERTEA